MSSINVVILEGNLTRNPELRYTPNGKSVCDFGLAVNEKYKDKEKTHFFDITTWGPTADACDCYLTKGSRVTVSGKLQQESWEDKETGQKRSKVKIVALNVSFGPKKDTEEKAEEPASEPPF